MIHYNEIHPIDSFISGPKARGLLTGLLHTSVNSYQVEGLWGCAQVKAM